MSIRVNMDRLKADIETLSLIGRDPRGGISRPSFSQADLEARAWLKDRIQDAGLAFRQDGAGNIFGRREGAGKTVMAGSHIDTVLRGGMFDGAAGVVSALECLRRIEEEKIPLARPVEVVSFTDEEGNLAGDFLGSRAFMGLLNEEEIRHGKTQLGPPLKEILKRTEWTVDSILGAHRGKPELEAFVELHIEQGPVLDAEEIPIGVVEAIAGKHFRRCSFLGKASHAGATPFELRRDAFLGLADFALKATHHVATQYYGSLSTIGKVNVAPGVFSSVPSHADFSFEFRSASKDTLARLEKELFRIAEDVASTRGLGFASKLVDRTDPVELPARMAGLIREASDELGSPWMPITSGAGHDAQILAGGCDAGMIFVPSVDGISHSPEETTRWEDLEKGANVLLQVLIRLAG